MTAIQGEQRAGRDPAGTALERLIERFDPSVFDVARRMARIRVEEDGGERHDVVLEHGTARLDPSHGTPDAVLSADADTWSEIAEDVRGGMAAFRRGRLKIRRDLHLGVGFLAATALSQGEGRLRIRHVETAAGGLSTIEAGVGDPVILLHGLGATKASFLPTIDALAASHRAIAVDLPGFGDSDKPLFGAYDPAFFAQAIAALLDAQGLDSAHMVGNSMGGRVALELGLSHAERVRRLVLLAPSMPWLKPRPWAPYLRLIPTRGPDGLWTRLGSFKPEALFVWGRKDNIVPIGFARHVRNGLPAATHLELDCGHVPQLERPRQTHQAMARFLTTGTLHA